MYYANPSANPKAFQSPKNSLYKRNEHTERQKHMEVEKNEIKKKTTTNWEENLVRLLLDVSNLLIKNKIQRK